MSDQLGFLPVYTQEFIIQPTSLCNINCRYCYLPDRLSPRSIDARTLARVFAAIFTSSLVGERVRIVWHAGEPMTLPLSFYAEAYRLMDLANPRQIPVESVFQTNGTRLTQAWCDFINARQIQIGISLDGPQAIHDANRVDRQGRGTFARAMRGLDLLQRNGIDPVVLMVLTRQALDAPDALWQFLLEHRLTSVAFLLEEALDTAHEIPLRSAADRQRYRAFLQRILTLRESCAHPPFVREIDGLIDRIKYLTHPVRAQANIPLAVISFDCEGNISTFSPELLTQSHPRYQNFWFGNVFENSLEELLNHPHFRVLNAEVQRGVARCRETCAYFLFCGGGSPANKLSENGTFASSETVHCALHIQTTTDVVLNYLEHSIESVQEGP
ncbi:MAG TPA: cyclophane-forming radical SAM/SPASM peptide maturase GrrM/OscB [Ktedonobacteraceae bacterium]